MSPNNNEVHIYAKKGPKWEVEHILKEVGVCSCELRHGSDLKVIVCCTCVIVPLTAWPACHWYGLGSQKQPTCHMRSCKCLRPNDVQKIYTRVFDCQDRNAYVWTLSGSEWKPALVILRINRAATMVKWSPKGMSVM